MQQKFLSGLYYLIFLNLLVKPVWIFGIERTAQNVVGAEYGLYFAIFNLTLIFNMILDFGINNYTSREVAQNHSAFKDQFAGVLSLKAILSLIYLLVLLVCGWFLGYQDKAFTLLIILGINQILLSAILFVRSNLSGLLLFKKDSFISVLDRILMIAACSVVFLVDEFEGVFTILLFAKIQTASYFVTLLMGLFFLWKIKFSRIFIVSKAQAVSIIKNALPFALLIFLMSIYTRIDGLMLEQMLFDGKIQAAGYAKGFRILEAGNMIAYLFSVLLLPLFSKLIQNKQSLNEVTEQASKFLLLPITMVAVCSWWLAEPIMKLLYWETNQQEILVFKLLILNLLSFGLVYIFGTMLSAGRHLKNLNLIAVLGVLANVVFNFFLIPKYGAIGAAYATLITQSLTAITQVILAKRLFLLPFFNGFMVKLAVFTLLLVVFGFVMSHFLISPLLMVGLLFFISILLVFGMQIIKFSDLQNLSHFKALPSSDREF